MPTSMVVPGARLVMLAYSPYGWPDTSARRDVEPEEVFSSNW